MSSFSIDDFKKPNGDIDWTAYHEAEVQAGERCMKCRSHIFASMFRGIFGGKDREYGPQLCGSCKSLTDDEDHEVTHDDYIRCPHCGHLDQISDWDCDYYREKYEDGEHTVYCSECEKEYEITTHCSFSYTSPPMEKKDGTTESEADQ